MFENYCEELDVNRNWLVDLLLNGASLAAGPFAWVGQPVEDAQCAELGVVRALVAAFEADYAALGC